jgi:hypothetical protein
VSALQTQARHDEALRRWLDTLKRMQAETAAELAALLPAILDKAFIRLHVILARRAGEL